MRRLLGYAGVLTLTFSGVNVGAVTAPDVFLVASGLLFVATGRAVVPGRVFWPAAVVLCVAAVGAERDVLRLDAGWRLASAMVIAPLVIGWLSTTAPARQRVAGLFVLSAGISATFGLVERFTTGATRPEGLAAHSNQLGLASAIGLLLAVALTRRNPRWWLPAIVCAGGVVASGSRTGIVVAMFGVILLLVLEGRLNLPAVLKAAALAAVAVVVLNRLDLDVGLSRLFEGEGVAVSNARRSAAADEAWTGFLARPWFGSGAAGIGAHNLYLTLAGMGGVITLGAFAVYAVRLLGPGLRARRADVTGSWGVLAFGMWLFAGLTHNGFWDRWLYIGPALLAGVVIERGQRRSDEPAVVTKATREAMRRGRR